MNGESVCFLYKNAHMCLQSHTDVRILKENVQEKGNMVILNMQILVFSLTVRT